ncbi:MAG: hypothetical protein AAFR11_13360 [Pseudomonadota bacterium]
MTDAAVSTARPLAFGAAAMVFATLALIVAVAHLTLGPFAPQEPVEKTVAETAVAIKDFARRAITGEDAPPAPPPPPRWDADKMTEAGVLGGAGLAMLLAVAGLLRREPAGAAFAGFALGGGVLLFTWLQWIALIICGAIILAAIIANLSDILSF